MQIQENVIHRPRQNSLQDLHNSSHHRIRRVNAYIFQIWQAPAGYEKLGKGLEPIRNGEMLNSRHPVRKSKFGTSIVGPHNCIEALMENFLNF